MRSTHHPVYKMVSGGFILTLGIASSIFTLTTDESLIQGGHAEVGFSWEILKQPFYLLTGHYADMQLVSILGAYLIFCMYVMLSIIETLSDSRGLKTIVYILIGIDAIANYLYFYSFSQMPWLYQVMLTGLIYVGLVYATSKGIELIMDGIREMQAQRS